jgi:internalin A
MEKKSRVTAAYKIDPKGGLEIAEKRIAEWKTGNSPRMEKSGSRRYLDLSRLGLRAVPESLRDIPDLEMVALAYNEISELPEWMGELSAEIIDLIGNKIRALPESIASSKADYWLLDSNELEELPESLRNASHVPTLLLRRNPALQIPESILGSAAVEEIVAYYFESRGEQGRPLLELKLLLIGRGKAGKTTLVKQLAGEKPSSRESETHSIAIRELTLACPQGPVRTRAWDFGGQEILHSTHQFFLTERSLYLLVLEPRTGLAQRDAEFWLKLFETQGGGSRTSR